MKLTRYVLILAASIVNFQNSYAVVFRSSQIVGYGTGNLGTDSATGTLDG